MDGLSDWTESDIAKMKKAIATGAQSVSYKDRTVTYRSLSEMKQVLNDMIREVRGTNRKRRVNPQFDSGL